LPLEPSCSTGIGPPSGRAFLGDVTVDGIVGDQTWDVSLHAMMADLETEVGLEYVIG
jgi:hypothetical protein